MATVTLVHLHAQEVVNPSIKELSSCVTLDLATEEGRVTFFLDNLDQIVALAGRIEDAAVELINGKESE